MSNTLNSSNNYFSGRFMDFNKDRELFRTFPNPFEALYGDAEPTLQVKVINLYCIDELWSKFIEGDLLEIKSS
jgi:hypothetical protein